MRKIAMVGIVGLSAFSELVKATVKAAAEREEIEIVDLKTGDLGDTALLYMSPPEIADLCLAPVISSKHSTNNKPFYHNVPKHRRGRR